MSVNNKVNISSHPINASNVLKLLMSDIQPKVWNLCLIVLFRCKLCELEKQIVILNEKHEKVFTNHIVRSLQFTKWKGGLTF